MQRCNHVFYALLITPHIGINDFGATIVVVNLEAFEIIVEIIEIFFFSFFGEFIALFNCFSAGLFVSILSFTKCHGFCSLIAFISPFSSLALCAPHIVITYFAMTQNSSANAELPAFFNGVVESSDFLRSERGTIGTAREGIVCSTFTAYQCDSCNAHKC